MADQSTTTADSGGGTVNYGRLRSALGLSGMQDQLNADEAKINALEPGAMAPPKVETPPKPPVTDPLQAFGQPAMWLAAFGSLLTRQPLIAGIKGAAAVMQSTHQQDEAGYKQAYENWKLANENATKLAKFEQDAYKAAIAKKGVDARGAEAEVRTVAAAFKNAALEQVLDTEGMPGVVKYLKAHHDNVEKMGGGATLLGQSTDQQNKIAAGYTTNDPQVMSEAIDAWVKQTNDLYDNKKATPKERAEQLGFDVHAQALKADLLSGDPEKSQAAMKAAKDMFMTGTLKPPSTTSGGAAGAAEHDIETIANQQIADKEKEAGHPLSDAEKAQIRQDVRNGAKADTKRTVDQAGAISDDAADLAAERVLAGDERATTGMARSNANITKVTNSIVKLARERGMSGADIASKVAEFQGTMAGERTLGTRTANMEVAANEVKNMAPLALAASKQVDRTKYPRLNQILLAAEQGTGDENVVRFGLAANSLIYTYAKFLNPTGIPTDADKARATDILSTAWTEGQFEAAVDQIKREIQSGQGAIKATRDELHEGVTGDRGGGKTGAPAVGEVRKGYRFKGGNPADPNAWEKVQ